MKNSDYWKQRFTQLENAQNALAASSLTDIEKQYRQAQKQIEAQISTWYQRFAKNNGITMAEARQWLTGKDLKEFHWSVQDYIQYGQDNAITGQWMQELENASAKFHISKLEALKIHTENSLQVMFAQQQQTISGVMGDVFTSGYYHTAYELQHGFNIGFDIAAVDQSYLEKVLAKPWAVDGYNFSERIWTNKSKLISELHGELSRGIMTGSDPQKAIDAIAAKMNTSKSNAGRLVMTEEAYFSSAAQKKCFDDLDVEKYEIVATLDSHTSDICQSLDGQIFSMKDFEAGVTAPPFHPNCRSTTAPAFDEDFGQIGERAARDENGETYYVPDDMKYPEWKKAFVDGDKSGFDAGTQMGGATAYTHHKEPEAPKPKKEYLTEKKLKANIADADVQIENIHNQMDQVLSPSGMTYEDVVQAGGIDAAYEDAVAADKFYKVTDEMQQIENKYGGWYDLMSNGTDEDLIQYDKLSDEQNHLEVDLKKQGYKVNGSGVVEGISKEDAAAAMVEKAQLEALQAQIEPIEQQKAEWETKLQEKLIAKQKKAIVKEQMQLETEKAALEQKLAGMDVKTYSGIWKDDVTTADFAHLNIEGKKKYYEGKFVTETDPVLMQKYQDLYKQLQELETEGQAYADVQAKIKQIETKLNGLQTDLQKLQNGGIINQTVDDAFTQARKDAALWFDKDHGGFHAADAYFDPLAKTIHNAAAKKEHNGFYTYTQGSGGHNRPLAGFRKPFYDSTYGHSGWEQGYYVGAKKVWINYEGKGEAIRGLTTLIEKSTYDQDVWLQSGQGFATVEGIFGLPYGTLQKMSDSQLQALIGREERIYQFISTAVNEGGGGIFNSKPMKLNIYAPKGSQMLYASDVGAFGKGENEMILQRGGMYKITKAYWGIDNTDGGTRKLFIDIELHPEAGYDLFQQDPNEWTGSMDMFK